MKIFILVILGLFLSCFHGVRSFAAEEMAKTVNNPDEKAALESVQSWLEIMDMGHYEQCWEIAGADFKERISTRFNKEQAKRAWTEAMLINFPQSSEGVASRRLREKHYFNSVPPNWPNGEYFLFAFDAVRKNGREAEEWVSVNKEKDGQWRLNSYVIGPTNKQREEMMKKYGPKVKE